MKNKCTNHSTLFLDESGKSSLMEKAEEPFLITGVILENGDINTVEGFFSYIKRKYKLDITKPFHSYHIFEAPNTKLYDSKAKELVKTLADFISLIPIEIKIISIDKREFKKAINIDSIDDFRGSKENKRKKEYPYQIISANLFSYFARYLEKNNSIGE